MYLFEKFLWLMCLLIVLFTEFAWSQPVAESNLSEISVFADAEIIAPAQISRFTLSFETSAELFAELEKKLNSQLEDIKAKLKDVSYLSSRIEIDTTTKIGKAYIDCETKSSAALANALDTAKAGGANIEGKVNYSFSNEQDDAIKIATLNAKRKAEKAALNLGVKLGAPISISVAEEPIGALIMQARQLGGPIDPATVPQRGKVTVQARFAIQN